MIDSLPLKLQKAIAQLYETFQPYPLRPHVEGCTHCVHPEDHIRLQSKPLRQLSPADLSRYAFKALTTWGDQNDFRHFLPRIFELVAIEDQWWGDVDTEIVFSKLAYANWTAWPEVEQKALSGYFTALFQHIFFRPPLTEFGTTTDGIDRFLCAIGQAIDDLHPYLAHMASANSEWSLYRLAYYIDANLPDLIYKYELGNAFWEYRKPQMEQVIKWVLAVENERLITNALNLYLAKEDYPNFSSVAEYINAIRNLRTAKLSP